MGPVKCMAAQISIDAVSSWQENDRERERVGFRALFSYPVGSPEHGFSFPLGSSAKMGEGTLMEAFF